MKQRIRELARPGIYGSVDNPQIVTERDLREIAETFPEIQKAPISLNGHWPDPSRPRLGNVIGVAYDEERKILLGTIEEQEELAEAVDKGYFPDVSIGAKRRAVDGKMYLHHVAYLGEEPPAIKDLVANIQDSLSPKPQALAASDAEGVVYLPSLKAPRILLSDPPASAGATQLGGDGMKNLEEALAALDVEQKKNLALSEELKHVKTKLEHLAKQYPEALDLADPDPKMQILLQELRKTKRQELEKAVEGRIPKGKQALLLALADTLPLRSFIELSDGEQKRQVSPWDLLKELLEALPRPVQEGKLQLSDPAQEKPLDLGKLIKHV